MNELTAPEQLDFERLRATIARTKESAAEFYDALTQIHARKLYRATFATWEDFCQAELGTSARAIHLRLDAHAVRKEIGSTATEITDRTALALKNVKPVSRRKVFKKATKLAMGNPITPTHIARATGRQQVTIDNLSDIYASTPRRETVPRAVQPPTTTPSNATDAPLPPLTDPTSAVAHIEACYAAQKEWFNDLPLKSPRQIIDRLSAFLLQ